MVRNPEYAATWDWFFNEFTDLKFDKLKIIHKLLSKEEAQTGRAPSQNTLDRDVSCFLNTYAQTIPRGVKDPEEEYVCPFVELQLMTHQKKSGTYELNRRSRRLRPEKWFNSHATVVVDRKSVV